jgi:FkbM family methyltransferase
MPWQQAAKNLRDQFRLYRSLRGDSIRRMSYFFLYYFFWIVFRWGDRHARALRWLRTLGLTGRVVTFETPEGLRLRLDLYSVHHVFHQIVLERIYEPTAEFRLRPGDVVVDVGAQQGIFSCLAARQVGERGKVISFEPHPGNFALLTENATSNHLTSWTGYPTALGAKEGRLTLYVAPYSVNHSVLPRAGTHGVEVACTTLDVFARNNLLDRLDLLKVDVEGAEFDVLSGAVETLRRCHPKIVMEIERPEDPQRIPALLKPLGYDVTVRPGYIYATPTVGMKS